MNTYPFLIGLLIIVFQSDFVLAQNHSEKGMKWESLKNAQQKANAEGKMVLIFGYAEWCTYCRKMRNEVYTDSSFQSNIYSSYYPAQLNVDSEEKIVFNGKEWKEKELAKYLRIVSLPTHFFIDEKGEIIGSQPGFLPTKVFGPLLEYVGTGASSKMKFEEFLKNTEQKYSFLN